MRVPPEAGQILVDVRPIGRLPGPARILVALPPFVVFWLLTRLFREVRLVCTHGLVIRNVARTAFVPWSQIRGLRALARSVGGTPYTLYLIDDTARRPIRLPFPATRAAERDLEAQARHAIEDRTGTTFHRELPARRP